MGGEVHRLGPRWFACRCCHGIDSRRTAPPSATRFPTLSPSLRAERSNPVSFRGGILDCFVARAPRNDAERASLAMTAERL
ncbi:hypothetical protein FXB38_00675 [Bradyrhizobium cytisi]|uniref:Uncharacterized protein n=1 Tax=Bradyrhizobium cytisi TaxID=515489 RepID=A0A5S4X333_9BRAD|nr:hypothetical protein FXB38_00675 [Bradyrhizobium cytisi]